MAPIFCEFDKCPLSIMEIEVDYYKKLYKSTNPDNDKLKKYIENIKVHNKLSNNESEK
jgi:hypothetical protein